MRYAKSLTTCLEGSAFPFLVANGVVSEKQLSELTEPLCTAGIASFRSRLPQDSETPRYAYINRIRFRGFTAVDILGYDTVFYFVDV